MRFVLERTVGPELEPVTLAEMKRHLGEFDSVTERDDDITDLITAAREWVEDFTGRVLVDQTWRLTFGEDWFFRDDTTTSTTSSPTRAVKEGVYLRKSPALAVVSFVSVDSTGAETAVTGYEIREGDSKWPRVVSTTGASWATGNYRLVFRAGYADQTGSPQDAVSVIPSRFRQAIKLHVEAHYDRNADMEQLIKAAENLIRPERCELGFQ